MGVGLILPLSFFSWGGTLQVTDKPDKQRPRSRDKPGKSRPKSRDKSRPKSRGTPDIEISQRDTPSIILEEDQAGTPQPPPVSPGQDVSQTMSQDTSQSEHQELSMATGECIHSLGACGGHY